MLLDIDACTLNRISGCSIPTCASLQNTPSFDRPTSHQVLEVLELFGKRLVRPSLTERRPGLGHNALYLRRHGYLPSRVLQCDIDWADGAVSTHPSYGVLYRTGKKRFHLYTTDSEYCVYVSAG